MNQNLQYSLTLNDLFSKGMGNAINQTKKLDSTMNGLKSTIGNLGIALGGAFLVKDVIQTTAKFQSLDNAIKATGDARNLKFLNDQVDRLGLDITAAYNGYKTFSGALMGTSLAGKKGNEIFRQVSEATTVMGLSGEQTEGAFLALGQMMSKGTVSAEELRGQLGERIPGAFQIAAKAMGVTTAQLGDMMKKGQLVSDVFLPKFGAELEKRFGGQAAKAAESLQSNLNRLDAEWQRLKVTLGTSFLPMIIQIVKVFVSLLKVLKALMPVIKVAIILWASYRTKLLLANLSTRLFTSSQYGLAKGMGIATIGTKILQGGIRGIGTAIKAVPIIGWILAIISAIIELWQTCEGFRAFWYAVWEVMGTAFETFALNVKGNWHMLVGVITGDKAKILQGAKEIVDAAQITKNAWGTGWDKGVVAFRKDNPTIEDLTNETNNAIGDTSGGDGTTTTGGKGGKGMGSSGSVTAKPQNIYINITKLVESINIKNENINVSAQTIKDEVSKALLEAVNDVNLMAK
jgi:tape measure domain-containing protein